MAAIDQGRLRRILVELDDVDDLAEHPDLVERALRFVEHLPPAMASVLRNLYRAQSDGTIVRRSAVSAALDDVEARLAGGTD